MLVVDPFPRHYRDLQEKLNALESPKGRPSARNDQSLRNNASQSSLSPSPEASTRVTGTYNPATLPTSSQISVRPDIGTGVSTVQAVSDQDGSSSDDITNPLRLLPAVLRLIRWVPKVPFTANSHMQNVADP